MDWLDQLSLKSYSSAVYAVGNFLRRCTRHPFDATELRAVEADVVQDTYDFTGGGRFGPKTNVHEGRRLDHGLPYLLAVTSLTAMSSRRSSTRTNCEAGCPRACSSKSL